MPSGYYERKKETKAEMTARFHQKYVRGKENECWIWPGKTTQYARFFVNGKKRQAHVIAWELYHNRPFPTNKEACHTCDTPRCVNPRHVEPGSHVENMEQSLTRNRHGQKRKTHCNHGHEFTPENTYSRLGGRGRECKQCVRIRKKLYTSRKK